MVKKTNEHSLRLIRFERLPEKTTIRVTGMELSHIGAFQNKGRQGEPEEAAENC